LLTRRIRHCVSWPEALPSAQPKEKLAGMLAEFEKWRQLSVSTDGDYADSNLGGFLR
jgi:hypothetical protein